MSGVVNDYIRIYESKFNALADRIRLLILHILCVNGRTCVCELSEKMNLPQSKLSYHLKILLDAGLITKENEGTWSYYEIDRKEISNVLSSELCCLFVSDDCCE